MPGITVSLPAVLGQLMNGERTFVVDGETVGDALADLVRQRPALALHLFDESGAMRRYVLCFHNEEYVRGAEELSRRVRPGDTITILNSVSGG